MNYKTFMLLGVFLFTLTGCFCDCECEDNNSAATVNTNTPVEVYNINEDPTIKSDGEHYIKIIHPEVNDTVEMPLSLEIETEGLSSDHELNYDIYFDNEKLNSGRHEMVKIEVDDLMDPEEFVVGEHTIKVILNDADSASNLKSEISDTVTFFIDDFEL